MQIEKTTKIKRFGLPSKGRMKDETMDFFKQCGFEINKRHKRQYTATLTGFPSIQIVFQRQQDIIKGVQNGNLVFGIVGKDLVKEYTFNEPEKNVIIHDSLGFGTCSLEIAIPERWNMTSIQELKDKENLRIASKFPNLTTEFLSKLGMDFEIVSTKGTIEVAPALDYSDIIVDLVSTGQTLADNRLKRLNDGCILSSQAIFIGNTKALKQEQQTRKLAKIFLEYFDGALRAKKVVSVFVNMRGNSQEEIANLLFSQPDLSGLQGPTISNVISPNGKKWFAIHIIVAKKNLRQSLDALRNIGGSGVVVTPCSYVFEEEPPQYQTLLKKLDVNE